MDRTQPFLPFTDSDCIYIAKKFRSVISSLRVSSATYTKYTVLTMQGSKYSIQKIDKKTFLVASIPGGRTQIIKS